MGFCQPFLIKLENAPTCNGIRSGFHCPIIIITVPKKTAQAVTISLQSNLSSEANSILARKIVMIGSIAAMVLTYDT
ncbi:Uncharacterised protein [Mycobacteroides abscessus subsp. abscessus]|nr:Uncharacterised protein [Mycobacteroides abscessus subsp. abscessus]